MIMGTSEPTVIDDALSSKHKHYVEGDDDAGDGDDGDENEDDYDDKDDYDDNKGLWWRNRWTM